MATVDQLVTAKFVLDSSGFNSGIKGINAELRNARSELQNASTQLGVFGKDSEKLKSVQEALARQVELHSKKVDLYRQSMEQTTQKMNDNIKERDKLKASLDKANKSYDEAVKLYGKESEQAKKAKEEVDKLTTKYNKKEKAIETNAKQIQNYETNMNKANVQMTKAQGELNKINDELAKSENGWLKASESLKEHGEKLKTVGKGMEDAGKGILKATAPLVGLGAASLKAGIDFESAFAGVKKTVDATDQELARLSVGIRDMAKEIPASATAIAGVAEAAGQLGIETDNILGFTRVMIDLGEATNLSADEAATSFARFANIVGMSQNDFDKLGSSVVALGNSLATTESEIVAMGMGLAGAGAQVGLTEAQIMGFAGALSSVGIEAAAGGTAFSKVMIEMQLAVETSSEKLDNFASVAGMSAEEFSRAFKDDAASAIMAFVEGIGLAEEQGTSAIKVLDDMGITEVRLRDALLRASGASEVFSSAIETGTKAWSENTALADEAAQRYETTESKLAMLKNQFVDAGIKLGEVLIPYLQKGIDKVGEFADWLGNLDSETIETTAKIVGFTVAIGGILTVGGNVVTTIGTITTGLSTVAGWLGTATTATAGLGTAAGVAGGVGGIGALATGLGGVVTAAAPFLAAGAAVAGVGYVIYEGLTQEVVPAVDLFADKIEYTATAMEDASGMMVGAMETTTIAISEGTKEAVGAYLELDTEAKKSLESLYINSVEITEDTKADLERLYSEMAKNINDGLAKKREEDIRNLEEFFRDSGALTDKEQRNILNETQRHHSNLQRENDNNEKAIKAILDKASKEKRTLTDEERKEINRIQNEMKTTAIKTLSDQEVEAKVLLERMKANDARITAEQASEHIKTVNKSRDDAIKAAEQEYDGRVAAIIRLRDEAGTISEEQAEKLIEEAQRTRDESIQAAEDTRDEVIDKMFEMHEDLEDQVDRTTGKILTWWDSLKNWWDSWWPEPKTVEIHQVTYETTESLGGGGGDKEQTHAVNWRGNSSFEGGLTTLHERGFELYDLPRGTRIYNHEASENMVLRTAEEVAKRIVLQNNGGKDVNVTQHIYVPTPSPSEVARQTKKQLQTMAFGL